MSTPIRALAGILYAGEASLKRSLTCLEQQQDIELRTVMFGHHPFADAHQRLYRTFDERRLEHDLLVKVDADMEIIEPRLLHALGMLLRRHPEVDEILVGVEDWLSGERIMGMMAWRRGMRWRDAPSALFADLPATSVRTSLKLMDAPHPLVLHATSPSATQSLRYGAQRGLKVIETRKLSRWRRMQSFVRFAAANPEPERRLAVVGVEAALTDSELAGRCLYGAARLSSAEQEQLKARSGEPTLFGATLDRLAALESTITPSGTGADGATSPVPADARAFLLKAKRHTVGRIRPSEPIDRPMLREEFLGLLRG